MVNGLAHDSARSATDCLASRQPTELCGTRMPLLWRRPQTRSEAESVRRLPSSYEEHGMDHTSRDMPDADKGMWRAGIGAVLALPPLVLVAGVLSVLTVTGLSAAYQVPRHVYDSWWWYALPLVHAASLSLLLVGRRRRWWVAVAVAVVVGGVGGLWPWSALGLTTMFHEPTPAADTWINLLFWVYLVSLMLLIGAALHERAKARSEYSTWPYLGLLTAMAISLQAAWAVRVLGA